MRENAHYGPHGGEAETASASLTRHLTEAAALADQLAAVLSAARRDTAGLESTRSLYPRQHTTVEGAR